MNLYSIKLLTKGLNHGLSTTRLKNHLIIKLFIRQIFRKSMNIKAHVTCNQIYI